LSSIRLAIVSIGVGSVVGVVLLCLQGLSRNTLRNADNTILDDGQRVDTSLQAQRTLTRHLSAHLANQAADTASKRVAQRAVRRP
jgi:hypothetical protein